jgi:hypothetical protein
VAARLPQGVALVDGPGAGQRSRGDRRPAGHLRRRLPARVRPGRADPGRARHATRAKRANVESGSYPPNFKLSLALKDLRLVDQTAQRAGRHLPLARASRDWLERAANSGAGDLDYSAVIATITDGGRSPA